MAWPHPRRYFSLHCEMSGHAGIPCRLSCESTPHGTWRPCWVAHEHGDEVRSSQWQLLDARDGYVKIAPAVAKEMRLDLSNPEQAPVLVKEENVSGQFWKLTQKSGAYTLSTMWTGDEKVLAAVAAPSTDQRSGDLVLRNVDDGASSIGSLWRVEEEMLDAEEHGVTPQKFESLPADASQDDDGPTCRICFDSHNGTGDDRLFSPCRCRGSMRYVHVGCLDEWRRSAVNAAAHYRCESCHYTYRVHRTWIAQQLLSPGAPACLVAFVFTCIMIIFGLGARLAFPVHHRQFRYWLLGALEVHVPTPRQAGGNLVLWAVLHMVHAPIWKHDVIVFCAQVSLGGILALALPGFILYFLRELKDHWWWPEGGLRIDGRGGMQLAWFACFASHELGRIAIVVGVAASLRELYVIAHKTSKRLAQLAGERILEV